MRPEEGKVNEQEPLEEYRRIGKKSLTPLRWFGRVSLSSENCEWDGHEGRRFRVGSW